MDTPPSAEWVDAFLFWDAVTVASLMLIDFLIGKNGRRKLQEAVGY